MTIKSEIDDEAINEAEHVVAQQALQAVGQAGNSYHALVEARSQLAAALPTMDNFDPGADIDDLVKAIQAINVQLKRLTTGTPQLVNVAVTGEGGDFMIRVTLDQLSRLKALLAEYSSSGEWHDEINAIIDNAPRITAVGTINTSGDGGGWYDNE